MLTLIEENAKPMSVLCIPISLEPGQTQNRTLSFVANVAGELPFPRISIECNNELDAVINSYAIKALPKAVLVLVSFLLYL
uniref:Uncharacterized protein n=1 Tax=Panagrolaimus sp. ES5 TaxID=591445 RepID=A0AC34F1X3_9BILA